MTRLGLAIHGGALLILAALGGVALHARQARTERRGQAEILLGTVRRLPSADFALSGSGRHLRHVSLTEPSAAFVDVVAGPDGDPAGGALAPPREVWSQ